MVERRDRLYLRAFRRDLRRSLSIPSHITARERATLNRLARGKKVIVEIGSYLGASAAALAAANSDPGVRVYCIDTWGNDAMSEGKRDTFSEFERNTQEYCDRIIPLRGLSRDQAPLVASREPQIDLLFIDGDHSYEGVLADWENYGAMLRSGSVVVFHDYGWASGVKRVVVDRVLPRTSSSGNLPNLWWGIIA